MKNILKGLALGALLATLIVSAFYTGRVDAAADASKTYMNLRPQFTILHGGAADTTLLISGITTADQLLDVFYFDTNATALTFSDFGFVTSISSADSINIADSATADGWVIVLWQDVE